MCNGMVWCLSLSDLMCINLFSCLILTDLCDAFLACHPSCKLTCSEAGPIGCDECRDGWQLTDDKGCVGEILLIYMLVLRDYIGPFKVCLNEMLIAAERKEIVTIIDRLLGVTTLERLLWFNYGLQITEFKFQLTDCKLLITSHRCSLQITDDFVVDLDECEDVSMCGTNEFCTNTDGSYRCTGEIHRCV